MKIVRGQTFAHKRGKYAYTLIMRKGFTLIEIMVVVVIIGLLLTIGIPMIGRAKDQSLIDRASADITLLNSALEQYKSTYPGTNPSNVMTSNDAAFANVLPFMKVDTGITNLAQFNANTILVYNYVYSSADGQFEAQVNAANASSSFPPVIPTQNGTKPLLNTSSQ
jgi:prepilin-type N-terminal cleavage/methylation domain-containing protein